MNDYSPLWFELFLHGTPAATTAREIAFLERQLPRARYPRLLDLCCGPGRHALPLARLGYRVTGVDVNAAALASARATAPPGARFLALDMRALDWLDERFDAALILWQSFGHFDPATNEAILAQIARLLDGPGRLVLDIYHREFFASRLAPREHERGGRRVVETKEMSGARLSVTLDYDAGERDRFSWELYTPAEIEALARATGFAPVLACRDFDETLAPSAEQPRMQLVFERK
jgi:SAM-dependent methyltransferase